MTSTTRLTSAYADTSLSTGTMIAEDLIATFAAFLRSHDPDRYDAWYDEYDDVVAANDETLASAKPEDVHYALDDLFVALDEISPVGCKFGAHVGNGDDYGWWGIEDEDDEDQPPEGDQPDEPDAYWPDGALDSTAFATDQRWHHADAVWLDTLTIPGRKVG